uniref:Tumor protein p73 n=2 Tax=Cacopsylla melanoneura TaxID=428564 RepID=A0A8D9E0U0_9HEMI
MALNHHINGNPAQQNGHINTTLPTQSYMLNSGDMRKYMGEMTDSDVERAFDNILTSSPPPVRDLQIDESYETHQTETIVMCDSTHLHVNDTYPPPTGADHPPSNMLIIPQHYQPVMAPSCSEATIFYPSINDYPGDYNFEILLDGTGSGFKAWMYSYELNKVFIDIGKVLPIQVKLLYKQEEPVPPLFLRATPIYSQDDFRGRPVERCPLHVCRDNKINEGFESVLKHIVRCTSAHCQYPVDERSGRHTCVTPLSPPQPGADTVTLMYNFVCKTSCLGGMDRRPVLLLLTLENQHGQILGRRSLSVKICACPKRDKEKEEKEFQTSGGGTSSGGRRVKGRKRSLETRVKEEMMDDNELTTENKKFCPDLFNIGLVLSTLPPDHKYFLLSNMSTLLSGMFMKKRNEACRQAADACEALVEQIKNEIDPSGEQF